MSAPTFGATAGWAMPRGPITTSHVLGAMLAALVVGFATGYLTRSRWAMLVAPLSYALAFELSSARAVGVTVDWPSVHYAWGYAALIVGRGVHALVVMPAMIVMIAVGAGVARRHDGFLHGVGRWQRPARWLRRAFVAGTLIGVGVLAVVVARPAAAPPVVDAAGERVAGSIAELRAVDIGGVRQWISVRGHSQDAPVLLYVPGGPGQSDIGQARVLLRDLEEDFVVVTWDGRGVGRSYPTFAVDLSQSRVVEDTVELADYLRERFDEERIYLFGESGGSVTGVMAVQQAPDRFHAWLGSGQMVDPRATDRRIRRDLLRWARANDEQAVVRELERIGEPPYADPLAYAWIMGYYGKLEGDWDAPAYYERRFERSGIGFMGLGATEYAVIDKVNAVRGLMDVFTQLYPTWQDIDFRTSASTLDVPVYIFSGEHELAGRRDLAREWFDELEAPSKQWISYEHGGHAAAFENFRAFHRTLVDEVLPATYSNSGAARAGHDATR